MPTYNYRCDACGKPHEEMRRMSAPEPTACPNCKEPFGKKFNREYVVGNLYIKGDPVTFGQQAELNYKRMGKEQTQLVAEQVTNRKSKFTGRLPKGASINTTSTVEPPWFRDGSIPGLKRMEKPLDTRKIKNKEKYIMTGETE